MFSGEGTRALPRVGFPIRTSRDRWLVSTSSGLNAAAHVLHRLLAPRHPPCALRLLIVKNTLYAAMEFSRCTPVPKLTGQTRNPARRQVSQNSAVRQTVEVDIVLGELEAGRNHQQPERLSE